MGIAIGIITLVIGLVILLVVLMKKGKAKPVRGLPLVATIWIGSGLGVLCTKLLRPEMNDSQVMLAIVPVLCVMSAFAIFRRKQANA